ncbi:MAG: hypothetical protein ACRCWG_05635 [Sarcina sp.]
MGEKFTTFKSNNLSEKKDSNSIFSYMPELFKFGLISTAVLFMYGFLKNIYSMIFVGIIIIASTVMFIKSINKNYEGFKKLFGYQMIITIANLSILFLNFDGGINKMSFIRSNIGIIASCIIFSGIIGNIIMIYIKGSSTIFSEIKLIGRELFINMFYSIYYDSINDNPIDDEEVEMFERLRVIHAEKEALEKVKNIRFRHFLGFTGTLFTAIGIVLVVIMGAIFSLEIVLIPSLILVMVVGRYAVSILDQDMSDIGKSILADFKKVR